MDDGRPEDHLTGKRHRTVHVVRPDAPASASAPVDENGALLDVLRAIHTELKETRAESAAATQRLQKALRTEMEWSRMLLRTLVNDQYKPREDEIVATLGPLQLGFAQTLDAVHEERLSLTRIGDGELLMMANPDHHLDYQRNSAALRRDLAAAITAQGTAKDRLMVALPHVFRGDLHWFKVWITVWDMLKPMLDPDMRYGDAHVSRPVFFRAEGTAGVAQWRRLWQGRNVLVVTGRGSRFDVIPELFDGAKRIDMLHCAPTNAYEDRHAIFEAITARATRDAVILLSLGPAATVLAPRLAAAGFQALDVGHLSASYLNVYAKGARPESMPVTRK